MVETMKFEGIDIKGKGEGTKIGFPTANIEVSQDLKPGIYAGYTAIGEEEQRLPSIFYIAENSRVIESHILDFSNKDLYGNKIMVRLAHKIRDVQEFSSLDEARSQIKIDEAEAREWFKNND